MYCVYLESRNLANGLWLEESCVSMFTWGISPTVLFLWKISDANSRNPFREDSFDLQNVIAMIHKKVVSSHWCILAGKNIIPGGRDDIQKKWSNLPSLCNNVLISTSQEPGFSRSNSISDSNTERITNPSESSAMTCINM